LFENRGFFSSPLWSALERLHVGARWSNFGDVSDKHKAQGCAGAEVCPQPFLCPLSQVNAGVAVRIKQLAAPPELTHRLREMGFCEEQKIKLLSRQSNLICQVCNARLGISARLAEQILVEPLARQKVA
jgi:Fe2+ transport system protein FeoA